MGNKKQRHRFEQYVSRFSTATEELKKPQVVYMLSREPVYVHSYRRYAQAGLSTARTLLNQQTKETMNATKNTLNMLIPFINAKTLTEIQKVNKVFNVNFTSIEGFVD